MYRNRPDIGVTPPIFESLRSRTLKHLGNITFILYERWSDFVAVGRNAMGYTPETPIPLTDRDIERLWPGQTVILPEDTKEKTA